MFTLTIEKKVENIDCGSANFKPTSGKCQPKSTINNLDYNHSFKPHKLSLDSNKHNCKHNSQKHTETHKPHTQTHNPKAPIYPIPVAHSYKKG